MKNIYILSILVLAFLAIFYIINIQYEVKTTPTLTPAMLDKASQLEIVDIDFNNQKIKAASFSVDNPAKISLIPNFDERATAFEIFEKYKCRDLINGGFYLQEKGGQKNLPIGLFITNGQKIGNAVPNLLFNGFLKISKDEVSSISKDSSEDNFRIALQSGPILIQNGYSSRLQIVDDKPERRSVVALAKDKIYFIIFYDKNSVYLGPFLTDMPQIIKIFGSKKDLRISDALNLDGGGASTFHSKNISLPELSPVGNFFCIKN